MPNAKPLTLMGVPIVWDPALSGNNPDYIIIDEYGPLFKHLERHMKTGPRFTWDTYSDGFGLTVKEKAKLNKLPPYKTVGVRFIHGHNLAKVYTYRVRKAAKVHLGQEVIVESNPPTGWTKSLAVIVRIDKTPTDTGPYNYLFITQAAKDL